jgi:thioredoxin-dependent peroxiredoxin
MLNTSAPDFTAKDQNGQDFTLSNLKGKKIILYFYPKDNTSGCTAQACNLRDNMPDLTQKGFVIIGISPDNEKSHKKFIEKFDLNFMLIADTDHVVSELYGVWKEKSMYGRKYMGINRTTFVINEEGIITQIIDKVKTAEHSSQIQ